MSMSLIKLIVNGTHGAKEPRFFISSFSIMEPGAVSYLCHDTKRFVTHDGMLSVKIIRIQENNLCRLIRGDQLTNRVYKDKINCS